MADSRPAVTVSSSMRATDRPEAATSRTATSGSGRRSKSASTRAAGASCADEPRVGARPEHEPEGVDQEALPGTRLSGDDVEPGGEGNPDALQEGKVGHRQLQEPAGDRRDGIGRLGRSR